MKRIILFLMLPLLLISCDQDVDVKSSINKEQLQGDWVEIIDEESTTRYRPSGFYSDFGLGFQGDSLEIMGGIRGNIIDSITGQKTPFNYGNFTQFDLKNDSIWIFDPVDSMQRLYCKINMSSIDTLEIMFFDSTKLILEKITYDDNQFNTFNEIDFQRTSCYGSCPVYKMNLKKNGELSYKGIDYVDKIGDYQTLLDSNLINFIFTKFYKADILNLENDYAIGHTDDFTIITTYLKDGKVVKKINDYGAAGPTRLNWAYLVFDDLYISQF